MPFYEDVVKLSHKVSEVNQTNGYFDLQEYFDLKTAITNENNLEQALLFNHSIHYPLVSCKPKVGYYGPIDIISIKINLLEQEVDVLFQRYILGYSTNGFSDVLFKLSNLKQEITEAVQNSDSPYLYPNYFLNLNEQVVSKLVSMDPKLSALFVETDDPQMPTTPLYSNSPDVFFSHTTEESADVGLLTKLGASSSH